MLLIEKKMALALELLKQIAKDNADIIEENTPMGFTEFGDYALTILFIYYIKKEK